MQSELRASLGRSWQIFERDDELAELQELMARCLRREGTLVAVSGVSSTGKSALLYTFMGKVTDSGARIISAVGSRTEKALPFGIIRQLLRSAEPFSSTAKGLNFLLEADAFGRSFAKCGLSDVDVDAAQLLNKLSGALLELANQGPVVIVVDDVQYSDVASLQAILYLGRRISFSPILLILAQGEPADVGFDAELLGQPRVRRIRLGMLSPRGVTHMVASCTGIGSPQRVSDDWYALSGGNPLLVRALLEDTRATYGASADVQRVPVAGEAFEKAVLTCLHRCAPETRTAAETLAVLFQPESLDLIAQLADMDIGAAERAMRELSATGMAEAGGLRHQDIRAAVLVGVPEKQQADKHRRAARLLRLTGADSQAIARHLVCAAEVSESWQHAILEEAAEQALADGEPEFAVRCLRLAHHNSGADRLAAVRALLARAEWTANPLAAEIHLSGLADAIREDRLTCRYAILVVKYLLWFGRLKEALACFDCIEHRRTHPDCRHTFELNLAGGWFVYSNPTLGARVPEISASNSDADLPSGTERLSLTAARALSAALRDGARSEVPASGEHLLHRPALDDRTMQAVLESLLAMIYSDCLHEAVTWSDELEGRGLDRFAPTWQALFTWLRAEIMLRLGQLNVAERLAQTALARISWRSWGIAIGGPVATVVQASTAMGKTTEAARYLSRTVPEAMFESVFGLHYLCARGRYDLALNHPSAALDSFETCGELMERWKFRSPAIVPWAAGAAQSLIQLGEECAARELAAKQLDAMGKQHRRSRGVCLRMVGLASDLRQRRHMLSEAVNLLDEAGDRVELAYALNDLSRTLYTLGDTQRARLLRHRTQRLAQEHHVAPLCYELHCSMPEPASAPRRRPMDGSGLSELSGAERRVAALAAQGKTNREIARKLYITVSTVEQHLTRAYRKLRVSSRSDLAAIVMLEE